MPNISLKFEKIAGPDVSDDMLKEASEMFSSSYGVWGPLAAQKIGKFATAGKRVRMSPAKLKEQSLPDSANNCMVRALVNDQLAGYAFATRWTYAGRQVCWITQLCVKPEHRGHKLATQILLEIRECGSDREYGILSSHPAAIRAALRAFGRGIEEVDLSTAKMQGRGIMSCSPVTYIKFAKLKGSLFEGEENVHDGSVCCASTGFFVDHKEPLNALESVRAQGREWLFGDLPEGCEFLSLVKASEVDSSGESVRTKENSLHF